jgi:uncharacterized protein with HEPN domain
LSHGRSYVRHILQAVDKIQRYTAEGENTFRGSEQVQDAVIRNFEIIGEAVKNLSQEVKVGHPDVPWRQIGGMRDKLIHHYLALIWISCGKPYRSYCLRSESELPPLAENWKSPESSVSAHSRDGAYADRRKAIRSCSLECTAVSYACSFASRNSAGMEKGGAVR